MCSNNRYPLSIAAQGVLSFKSCLLQDVFDDGFLRDAPQSAVSVGFELSGLQEIVQGVIADAQRFAGFIRCQIIGIYSSSESVITVMVKEPSSFSAMLAKDAKDSSPDASRSCTAM